MGNIGKVTGEQKYLDSLAGMLRTAPRMMFLPGDNPAQEISQPIPEDMQEGMVFMVLSHKLAMLIADNLSAISSNIVAIEESSLEKLSYDVVGV